MGRLFKSSPHLRRGLEVLGFGLLGLASLSLRGHQVAPADLSFYAQYTWPFWTLLLGSVLCSTLAVYNFQSRLALVPLLLSVLLIYSVPFVLGSLEAHSSDPVDHTARFVRESHTGQIQVMRYGAIDAIVLILSAILGLDVTLVAKGLPLLSKAVLLSGSVFLLKRFTPRDKSLAVGLLWMIPIYGGVFEASLYPETIGIHFGVFFFGALLAIRLKPKIQAVLLLIFGASVIFFHPRLSGLVLITGGLYGITSRAGLRQRNAIAVFFAIGIIWATWVLGLAPTQGIVQRLSNLLLGVGSPLSSNAEKALRIDPYGLSRFFLTTFSAIIIAGLWVVLSLPNLLERENEVVRFLVVLSAIGGVGFLSPLVLGQHALSRGVQTSLFVLLLPLASGLSFLTLKDRYTRTFGIIMVTLCLSASFISVYRSPLMLQTSWHIDEQPVKATEWMDEAEVTGKVLSLGVHPTTTHLPYSFDVAEEEEIHLTASYTSFPASSVQDTWEEDPAAVIVYERFSSACSDDSLKDSIVVGNPTLHRTDLCNLLVSGQNGGWDAIYTNGPATIFRPGS